MDGARSLKNKRRRRLGEGGRRELVPPQTPAIALFLALAFPLLTLVGCGLEGDTTYYASPTFTDNSGSLTLTHSSSNSSYPTFLGYDIYYRAYSNQIDADAARTTIENAANLATSTPESVLSQMTNLNFKKIYLASAPSLSPTPLFNFSSGGNANGATTITIQLLNTSSTTNWYFITNVNSTPVQIVRCVGGNYNSFNYTYAPGDIDYASNTAVGPNGTLYIVAFAVAYGFDISTMATTYSFPTSLFREVWGGYLLPN
jgi:hypothetical protein